MTGRDSTISFNFWGLGTQDLIRTWDSGLSIHRIRINTVAGWEEVLEVEEGDAAHIDGDGENQQGRVNHFARV